MAHWIEKDNVRNRFWAFAKDDCKLTEDEVHEALKAESVKDYKGTMEQAKAAIEKFAADKDAQIAAERKAQRAQERAATDALLQDVVASFPSLPVWASTEAVDPSGFRWKVSIAAGLKPVLRVAAAEQVQEGVAEFGEWAACHGWTPANGNSYRAQRRPQPTRSAQPAAPQPQAPSGGPPEPPAPTTGQGPAPPPVPAGAQGGDGNEKHGTAPLEKITVDADGRVEFHVKGFRWPFKDARGGEVVAGLFDQSLGWQAAHFAPGAKYEGEVSGLLVDWAKPGKYYDVVKVHA